MAIRKIVSRALTDSLNVDSGTLVVDDANNRVGIGTATPSVDLDIQSTGSGTKLNIASTGAGINVDLTDASATSRIRHVGTILDFGADYTNTAVSNPRIRFRVGNTPQCSINAHGGIAFGNDTAAENTLDDYEEGTWTPTSLVNGFSQSLGYFDGAIYTKIGNIVHAQCTLNFGSAAYASSYSHIGGLPYGANGPGTNGRYAGGSISGGGDGGGIYIGSGNTSIYLFPSHNTASSGWTTSWQVCFSYLAS